MYSLFVFDFEIDYKRYSERYIQWTKDIFDNLRAAHDLLHV